MSVIFRSFGLSPFSPSSFSGIFCRFAAHPSSSSSPSAFRFQGQYDDLTKQAKNQPVEVLIISAQQDTATENKQTSRRAEKASTWKEASLAACLMQKEGKSSEKPESPGGIIKASNIRDSLSPAYYFNMLAVFGAVHLLCSLL